MEMDINIKIANTAEQVVNIRIKTFNHKLGRHRRNDLREFLAEERRKAEDALEFAQELERQGLFAEIFGKDLTGTEWGSYGLRCCRRMVAELYLAHVKQRQKELLSQ